MDARARSWATRTLSNNLTLLLQRQEIAGHYASSLGDEEEDHLRYLLHDVEKSPDGLEGDEGTFSLCTFWLVEALTRAGRLDEARLTFEQMLTYTNHVGLYAEEIGPSGEALGNFPQAFTHLTLISAAFNLDRVLGARDQG